MNVKSVDDRQETPISDENIVQIPFELVEEMPLSTVGMYALIASRADKKETTLDALHAKTGLCKSTVSRHVRNLREAGYVLGQRKRDKDDRLYGPVLHWIVR